MPSWRRWMPAQRLEPEAEGPDTAVDDADGPASTEARPGSGEPPAEDDPRSTWNEEAPDQLLADPPGAPTGAHTRQPEPPPDDGRPVPPEEPGGPGPREVPRGTGGGDVPRGTEDAVPGPEPAASPPVSPGQPEHHRDGPAGPGSRVTGTAGAAGTPQPPPTADPGDPAADGRTTEPADVGVPRDTSSTDEPEATPAGPEKGPVAPTSGVTGPDEAADSTPTADPAPPRSDASGPDPGGPREVSPPSGPEPVPATEAAAPDPVATGPHETEAASPAESARIDEQPRTPAAAPEAMQSAPTADAGAGQDADQGPAHAAGPREPVPTPAAEPDADPTTMQATIVCVANQKGGVGKTTTTVSLAAALALEGAQVLVVDLDPQGNATTGLGLRGREGAPSSYRVLIDQMPVEDATEPTGVKGLHCVPSSLDLAGAEIELVSVFSREQRLRNALEDVRDLYDVVIVDCPPSLGLLTINALVAADQVLVPIQCEYYALEGLGQLMRTLDLVQNNLNDRLSLGGVVLTMFDARTKLSQQVVDEVREHFGDAVYDTIIPRTVRLSEAPGFGQPINVFDPSSRGARAYQRLAQETAARLGLQLDGEAPPDDGGSALDRLLGSVSGDAGPEAAPEPTGPASTMDPTREAAPADPAPGRPVDGATEGGGPGPGGQRTPGAEHRDRLADAASQALASFNRPVSTDEDPQPEGGPAARDASTDEPSAAAEPHSSHRNDASTVTDRPPSPVRDDDEDGHAADVTPDGSQGGTDAAPGGDGSDHGRGTGAAAPDDGGQGQTGPENHPDRQAERRGGTTRVDAWRDGSDGP